MTPYRWFSLLCLAGCLSSTRRLIAQQHPRGEVRPPVYHFTSVAISDSSFATVVGENGVILRTTDGGATWARQASGTLSLLTDVSFPARDTGVTVGESGLILRTTNGGAAWALVPSPTSVKLRATCFLSTSIGLAVGDSGVIVRSRDGGATWIFVPSPKRESLLDIACLGPDTAIVVEIGRAHV